MDLLSVLILLSVYIKARDMWLGHSLVAPVHGLVKRGKHLLSVVKYSLTFAAQTVIPMELVKQRASSLLLFLRNNFLYVCSSCLQSK